MRFVRLVKRWKNMLFGKSTFHVEQGAGKCYSKTEIKGYYNDLTNKVLSNIELDQSGIPVNTTVANVVAYFPITIFQYALGLYDLYLLEKNQEYLEKFLRIANWAVEHQKENGMWDCMGQLQDRAHQTQSSMCQGEGASVLLRAYQETKSEVYHKCATCAIEFMALDILKGGTCFYQDSDVIFQEYVSDYNLSVLNGWIFSVFGLYDYTLIHKDEKYQDLLNRTIETMIQYLEKYDRGFWSNYDLKRTISSPAYHDLHIQQLWVLYDLFRKEEFLIYANKWKKYQNSTIYKMMAIVIKLKQKVMKNKYYDINTSLVR